MPIIFAQALMLFPLIFASFDATRGLAATLGNYTGFWYNFIFGFMVVAFTYFYTGIVFNSTEIAENLQKQGGFVEGVRPGAQTEKYLQMTVNRLILFGSLALGLIAIIDDTINHPVVVFKQFLNLS